MKNSAYRSMQIAKKGKTKKRDGNLRRWIEEDWRNLTPYAEGIVNSIAETEECGKRHKEQKGKSVCRPYKKITEQTPDIASSYTKEEIKKAVEIKNRGETIKWNKLSGGLRPFFCRVGNKTRLLNKIKPLIPEHSTYIEVFVGGGAVILEKEKSRKEIINDLDTNLINDWKLLRDTKLNEKSLKPDEFFKEKNIKNVVAWHSKNKDSKDKTVKLSTAVTKRCGTFQSIDGPNRPIVRVYNISRKMRNQPAYAERLKDVVMENMDYRELIKKYDNKDAFFYLDPPYENTKGLYSDEKFDFVEFFDILRKLKGKFLLSINDSPNVRRLAKGFNIKGFTVKSVGGYTVGAKPRKEVLIYNYNKPTKSGGANELIGGSNYNNLKNLGYALGDDDIKRILPDAKIIDYESLKKYSSIDELLPNDKDYVIILYEDRQNSGHWVCLLRDNNTIEFFCSYGTYPDHQLKWVDYNTRKELGSDVPLLSHLLDSCPYDVIYNEIPYQSENKEIATCGKHVIFRIRQHLNDMNLEEYQDIVKKTKPDGMSYDEYINNYYDK